MVENAKGKPNAMKSLSLSASLVLIASAVIAEPWALRAADAVLSEEEIATDVIGQRLVFYDNGESRFSPGGSYSYTYFQGGTAYGTYRLVEPGVICIDFRNGFGRCDKYVRNGANLVILTESGERYPVRP